MSNEHSKQDGNQPKKEESSIVLIIAAVASVVAVLGITVVLLMSLGRNIIPKLMTQQETTRKSLITEERLRPITQVNIGTISVSAAKAQAPEEIFESLCKTCHMVVGVGAPLISNKADWDKRFEQGYDVLVTHALNGLNAMPARGGNPKLSDAEVIGALDYMLTKVGIEVPKADAVKAEAPAKVDETPK